jgi:hypothetical protein
MLTIDDFYEIIDRDLDIVACLECHEYMLCLVFESNMLLTAKVQEIPKKAFNIAP